MGVKFILREIRGFCSRLESDRPVHSDMYCMSVTPQAAGDTGGTRKAAASKTVRTACPHGASVLVQGDETADKITKYTACQPFVNAKEKKMEGVCWSGGCYNFRGRERKPSPRG